MSKFVLFFSLTAIISGLLGCESRHDDDVIQRQEDVTNVQPASEGGGVSPEHGGSAGNK